MKSCTTCHKNCAIPFFNDSFQQLIVSHSSHCIIFSTNENFPLILLSSIGFFTFRNHHSLYLSHLILNILMSEKQIHSFEGICPLTHHGIYGIKKG